MRITKVKQRLTAWIACFAILLSALAPSISHAMAASKGTNSLFEVCTTTGTKLISASADQETPAAPSSTKKSLHLTEHCPFCSVNAASFGLLPTAALIIPLDIATEQVPSLFYQAPRPLFIWSTAQSRAPPFSS